MRLKAILFLFLVTANAYAYDGQENDEDGLLVGKSHYGSAQAMDLNNEDYGSMVTSFNSSSDSTSIPEDSMANYANYDDDNEY